jgi:hypothetical protein
MAPSSAHSFNVTLVVSRVLRFLSFFIDNNFSHFINTPNANAVKSKMSCYPIRNQNCCAIQYKLPHLKAELGNDQ